MSSKVSVIIPTYRRSDFLIRAVESVLSQDYPDVEVVVVDDNGAGTEARADTEARIAPYVGARLKLIQNAVNLGGGPARNAGIAAASGRYITFLDDDDIYLPGKIRIQAAEMDARGWDMTFMDATLADPDGRTLDIRTHDLPAAPAKEALLRRHMTHHLTPTATYMYRAEALRAIGGFDDVKTAQEFLLMLKSIERGLTIGYIKQSRVVQYLHAEGRISTGDNKRAGEDRLHEIKRRYMHHLTPAERRGVTMRHWAVLFFAHRARGEYGRALAAGVRAVGSAPVAACRLMREKDRMMRRM